MIRFTSSIFTVVVDCVGGIIASERRKVSSSQRP
jgi:hypothetical protein